MALYESGDRILNIKTKEFGFIIKILPSRRGKQMYSVKYDNKDTVVDEFSFNLEKVIEILDPFDRLSQNYYGSYEEYVRGNSIFKIKNSNNSTISSLKASRTIFKPYQFKPLLKFLNSQNNSILIADEVGLGKTIEAGHIMLELKARGNLKNALVVCPKSLCEKWATELNDKFGMDFIIIENNEVLIQSLKSSSGRVRAVINYDKLREGSEIFNFLQKKRIEFSIIVCDESHRLRNRQTLLYGGLKNILALSDAKVFMSATPVMIKEENLFNQLKLLDPESYSNSEVFENNVRLNKPFIHALSNLSAGLTFEEILRELSEEVVKTINVIDEKDYSKVATVDEYFKDYPIYIKIKNILQNNIDNSAIRAKLQYYLSEMNPLNKIFSRTRKREITQDWSQAERCPHTEYVELTADENNAYNGYIKNYMKGKVIFDKYGNRCDNSSIGLVSIKRQLASSVWACLNSEDSLDKGFDEYSKLYDAKYNKLLDILKHVLVSPTDKIIIFAIFKKTLKYLSIRLKKDGFSNVLIYGDSNINKYEVVDRFKNNPKIQILLSSEVGSEGLDMQFCSSLVNYDLPWNPMVVEQRIGRIDRFGQTSPKVNIYNIVVSNSILENIYFRLLDRIGIFRETIGDLEAILDAEIEGTSMTIGDSLKSIEREFYSNKLTEEEIERKQIEIERAIENEKVNLKKIAEAFTNTLTNDAYFKDEINKILNNRSYVTDAELYNLLKSIIKDYLTTCELEETEDASVFTFNMPKSDLDILRKFLRDYGPDINDIENQKLFSDYIQQIRDEFQLKLTFNQEKAFLNKRLTFINIYHPLIKAIVKYYEQHLDLTNNTFFYKINAKEIPSLAKGFYILVIFKISTTYDNGATKGNTKDSLCPVLYNLKSCKIEESLLAESLLGKSQTNSEYISLSNTVKLDKNIVENVRFDIIEYIDEYINNYEAEEDDILVNNVKMWLSQTIQYYERRENNLEQSIRLYIEEREITWDTKRKKELDGAIRLLNSKLDALRKEKEIEIQKIIKPKVSVSRELKSLSLVKIED